MLFRSLRNSRCLTIRISKTTKHLLSINSKMNNPYTSKHVPGVIPDIQLDKTESQVVNLLKSYTQAHNSQTEDPNDRITLRITGGWVRDKLLNQPSHDIDIGIDNCSGESFVNGLKQWLDAKSDVDGRRGDDGDAEKINSIHKIKKNPDKSKHLETCTTKLFGLDIDFVNLRSELYTEDSRIPTITTGTPDEDAHRRDATLNALFFNLETMKVEDYTKKGLEDLSKGILRTPLEPTKTFLDDPLRCLRLIRFASNYGFKIEQATLDAMKRDDIHKALETKISRERIGVEVKKMLVNKRWVYGTLDALALIREVNFPNVFGLGDTKVPDEWLSNNKKRLTSDISQNIDSLNKYLIDIIDSNIMNFSKVIDIQDSSDNDKILFYSSIILNHWRDMKVKVGKRDNYVSFFCVLNGIKMPLKLADNVALVTSQIERIRTDVGGIRGFTRSEIARRFVLPFQDKWEINLLINSCLECFEAPDQSTTILNRYEGVIKTVYDLKLEESFKEQILLNGKDLMKIINKKPGPWLKPLNERLFQWQLDHPGVTREDMVDYLSTISIE